jgi:Arc/MetJ-type ribon-helix-helix transcriptional regulator
MSEAPKMVELSEELQQYAEAEVRAGHFASVAEVVQHAVGAFRKLESLRQDYQQGRDEFARGEGVPMTTDDLRLHMKRDRSPNPSH